MEGEGHGRRGATGLWCSRGRSQDRVGDGEAGADPGPACDGRGGDLSTITDAHVIQGTIRPDVFLGGAMSIDKQASHRVFEEIVAHFDLPVPEMADSAIRLADAKARR